MDRRATATPAGAATTPAPPAPAPPSETAGPSGSEAIEEFEELFVRQYEPMVRVAYLLLGSRPEAEDIVQDAFARLDLRFARLHNPGGYLRRCVVNGATDVLRRRRVERRVRGRQRADAEAAARHARDAAPAADEEADEMADALAVLAPKRRAAVVLRYYAGLRDHEIAEVLGMRPGTVKSTLHRALAQLREVLGP